MSDRPPHEFPNGDRPLSNNGLPDSGSLSNGSSNNGSSNRGSMSHGFSHDEGGTALSPEEVLAEALLFGETDSAAFERAMQASSGEEIEHLEHAIGAIAVASGHLGPLPESVSSRCREALLGRIR
ncbi:MAG: hypothetical protein AAFQ17_03335, partial [Pseudomonadota bacterium]